MEAIFGISGYLRTRAMLAARASLTGRPRRLTSFSGHTPSCVRSPKPMQPTAETRRQLCLSSAAIGSGAQAESRWRRSSLRPAAVSPQESALRAAVPARRTSRRQKCVGRKMVAYPRRFPVEKYRASRPSSEAIR